jgi:cyclic beta-1,2-glucan synthetase
LSSGCARIWIASGWWPAAIRTLWAIEAISWKAFVETASRTEAALRKDPAGVYPRMDLPTRDRYRLELNRLASLAKLTEEEVAKAALERAEQARDAGHSDPRTFHVGYYLVGPGAKEISPQFGM